MFFFVLSFKALLMQILFHKSIKKLFHSEHDDTWFPVAIMEGDAVANLTVCPPITAVCPALTFIPC